MSRSLPKYVHLNGRLVATARAHINVFDRGLLYGDGLFDTLRAYRGRPFALDAHLARLRTSAAFLGMRLPSQHWQHAIAAMLKRNGLTEVDAWVRITLTRGPGAAILLPPARVRPTLIMSAGRLDPGIAKAQRSGVRVALLPFARHGFLAEHKVLAYLPGVLGKALAAQQNAFEGLFVDADGGITEGTTSNVFICRRNQLLTPLTGGILSGVTRRLVIEVAIADGMRVKERPLTPQDIWGADEAFLTSSLVEVLPVTALDGRPIGNCQPGPRTQRLQQLYRQIVDRWHVQS
jgi:branched-chain amino acid aminotransferase